MQVIAYVYMSVKDHVKREKTHWQLPKYKLYTKLYVNLQNFQLFLPLLFNTLSLINLYYYLTAMLLPRLK